VTLIYAIAAVALLLVVRTTYIFLRFRRLVAEQGREIGFHLSQGLSLEAAIGKTLSDLNRTRALGLAEATLGAVGRRIAGLSAVMETGNVVDILAQFTQRYLLLETRTPFFQRSSAQAPRRPNDNKVLYAAEHLDLQERGGYFLISPSTQADFRTKY